MVTGFDSATAGKKTITVTYSGMTKKFTVTVSEKPVVTPDTDEWKIKDDGNGKLIIDVPESGGNVPKSVSEDIKNGGKDVTIK